MPALLIQWIVWSKNKSSFDYVLELYRRQFMKYPYLAYRISLRGLFLFQDVQASERNPVR